MGNFCLAKSDAMWPMAQMATDSVSLAWLLVLYFSCALMFNMHLLISHYKCS